MVGRRLHNDTARFEVDSLIVEHHVALARHDDGVVDRACGASADWLLQGQRDSALSPTTFIMKLGSVFASGIIGRRNFDDANRCR
jgi:hypothetical protein